MCYAYPGPRCSGHTRKAVQEARAAYMADQTPANKERLETATREWWKTPEGIADLRAKGEHELALAYEHERKQAISAMNGDSETTAPTGTLALTDAETKLSARLKNPNSRDAKRLLETFPDASPALLHSLHDHENEDVVRQVVEHSNVSRETLLAIIDKNPSDYGNGGKAWRRLDPSVEEEADLASKYASGGVGKMVAEMTTNPDVLRDLAGAQPYAVASNQATPSDVLAQITDRDAQGAVAVHKNADEATLRGLTDLEPYGLSRNNNTPPDVLAIISERNPDLRTYVASNQNTSLDTLLDIVRAGNDGAWSSPHRDAAKRIAYSHNATVESLREIANNDTLKKDYDHRVREIAEHAAKRVKQAETGRI